MRPSAEAERPDRLPKAMPLPSSDDLCTQDLSCTAQADRGGPLELKKTTNVFLVFTTAYSPLRREA